MDLFEQLDGEPINQLPYDGIAQYFGVILCQKTANSYYQHLLNHIQWQHDSALIMGNTITTKRKVAFYGSHPFAYSYSNSTKIALPWSEELLALKTLVETTTNEQFNACLLNLYHNGSEGMSWHCDAEKALKKNGAIASLSLGAARDFAFKHKKTKVTQKKTLEHGSLLIMKGCTQSHWLHSLPISKKVHSPRINLTFRQIADNR